MKKKFVEKDEEELILKMPIGSLKMSFKEKRGYIWKIKK